MEQSRIRIFILLSLFLVGFTLYSSWKEEHIAPVLPPKTGEDLAFVDRDIPQVAPQITPLPTSSVGLPSVQRTISGQLINIKTDVLNIKIDPKGGDIVFANLPLYPVSLESPDTPYQLLDNEEDVRFYLFQTGLLGQNDLGPDSRTTGRAVYNFEKVHYELLADQDELIVPLVWEKDGIKVTKLFTFKRGDYLATVDYVVENTTDANWVGSVYGQIKRQHREKKRGFFSVQMYEGAAVHTADKPFKKISFKDMKESSFNQKIKGGWTAMLERYFLTAWIPSEEAENKYYSRTDDNQMYTIGTISSFVVPAQTSETVGGKIYMGPEIGDDLKEISPGLELTVDYGILWPISRLLFSVLKYIHEFVGNWGWSIIVLTIMIKLVFYKLSATSYKSMALLKAVQPKIEALKERCGEDKQLFSQQLMALYKTEKVNPLGGCLPILIQIPVFIALYYVLLESVELRQAPFIFWIKDLSIKDPYYVLPIIMGASMLLQQRMNPPPPDPMQAKIMMFMPILFTAMFLYFPAGLVLYWVVNNLVSMLQQWYISRKFGTKNTSLKAKNA